MSLFLVAKLTGKEIKFQGLNVWMPYIWTLGIMIFSTGLFIGGAGGEPRRTNMGLTYTNPQSDLYRADWQVARILGSTGGIIMTLAALMFFIVFFATLFSRATKGAAFELIESEPYHDEHVPAVQRFTPWVVAAVLLLIIAYAPPIAQTLRSNFPGARPYSPDSPVANESRTVALNFPKRRVAACRVLRPHLSGAFDGRDGDFERRTVWRRRISPPPRARDVQRIIYLGGLGEDERICRRTCVAGTRWESDCERMACGDRVPARHHHRLGQLVV